MLKRTNFLTVAVVSLIHALWPHGPEPWLTWGVAEIVVFLGTCSVNP